ncbi:DUF2754 family protein [Klebsiella pneumoniae]|nr:DUF2754 family protein [Klebsiella pneumoniae]
MQFARRSSTRFANHAVGLITWVISFWIAGFVIRRRPAEEA